MSSQKTPIAPSSIFTKIFSYLRNLFRKNTEAKTFVCGTALKDGYRRKQAEAKKFAVLAELNNTHNTATPTSNPTPNFRQRRT